MSTIQCVCGTRFSVDRAAPDGTVFCPSCGQALAPLANDGVGKAYTGAPPLVSPDMNHGQYVGGTYGGAATPSQGNPGAVVGFILSILSLMGCLILAPIGLFVSVKGLGREENRGLAIAGVVISSIQSVALLFVVGYFIVVIFVIGGITAASATALSQASASLQRQMQTDIVLEQAYMEVIQYEAENDRWPTGKEGGEIVEAFVDGWGHPLVFDATSDEGWRVVSVGEDGRFDTYDDIERSHPGGDSFLGSTNDFPDSSGVQIPAFDQPVTITSLEQAMEMMNSARSTDRAAAIDWLSTAATDRDSGNEVVEAMLNCLDDRRLKRDALVVIERWASEEQGELIFSHLAKLPEREVDSDTLRLVDLLVRFKDTEDLVALINHPSRIMRDKTRAWTRAQVPLEESIVDQCLADLTDKQRREFAVDLLKGLPVRDSRRDAVSRAIDPLLTDGDYRIKRDAIEVLKQWGPTTVNIEQLSKAGELDLLVEMKHPKVLEHLGKMLKRWPVEFRRAAAELRKIRSAGRIVCLARVGNSQSCHHTRCARSAGRDRDGAKSGEN